MKNELLHTPEGVRDLYGMECARKAVLRDRILDVFHRYGYQDIQTPTFEFFNVFAKERGSVVSKDMFKFFDKEGNTLVLRPDITPSIARFVAKLYADEDMPIRMCYCGNTFYNGDSLKGRMKEMTQIGAELIGDDTSDADAEMLACLIDSFQKVGLREFQVEIGHSSFIEALLKDLPLDEEDYENLYALLEAKNFYGIDEFLETKEVDDSIRKIFLKLSECFGSIEKISEIRRMTDREDIIAPIAYLEKLYHILSFYKMERYVYFDLAKLGRYKYYTGIIFQGYTHGTGEVICTGGRYDNLLKQFGKVAPSVGFAINLDQLMLALSRQHLLEDADIWSDMLVYEREQKEAAICLANTLRSEGVRLQMMKKFREKSLDDYISLAKRSNVHRVLYIPQEGEQVVVTDISSGTKMTQALSDFWNKGEVQ